MMMMIMIIASFNFHHIVDFILIFTPFSIHFVWEAEEEEEKICNHIYGNQCLLKCDVFISILLYMNENKNVKCSFCQVHSNCEFSIQSQKENSNQRKKLKHVFPWNGHTIGLVRPNLVDTQSQNVLWPSVSSYWFWLYGAYERY